MEQLNRKDEAQSFVANVELPDDARARIINAAEGETVSFAIATDLDRDGSFATNYFSATDKAIYSFGSDEDDVVRIPYSDIEKCFVKRCYGNALLRVCETNCSGEPGNFVRFTLSLAPIFDAAASFVLKMLETQSLDEAIRLRLYVDGTPTTYAKTRSDGGGAEPGTVEFYSANVMARGRIDSFAPGEITKYTVVLWIEGNDPDCVDWLIGGKLKVDMLMSIVH